MNKIIILNKIPRKKFFEIVEKYYEIHCFSMALLPWQQA